MLREDQRAPYFTDWQLQQLKRTNETLRWLNRLALRELCIIGKGYLTSSQYRNAGDFIVTIAAGMRGALLVRRELLVAGRDNADVTVKVIFGVICDECSRNGARVKEIDEQEDDAHSSNAPEPDTAHQSEIEALLELALRTAQRLVLRWGSRSARPTALYRDLNNLTLALFRQQRELRKGTRHSEPKIEIVSEDECRCRHQPMKRENLEHREVSYDDMVYDAF